DLQRIGIVNQTTMLASDTQGIADYLKQIMKEHFQLTDETIKERFADTRDTLCYATNDNQNAVIAMLKHQADLAIVIGGYNSSNTSHLVELCEEELPTYFANTESYLVDHQEIRHFDYHKYEEVITRNYLPEKYPVKVMITSGASCPDALVDKVIKR